MRPLIKWSWMMRSSAGGSQRPYQAPSGYTIAIGPPSQMRRQFAFVRRMPPCSDRPSSFSRCFRNAQASRPRSFSQHFGVVWSQQRKMCRLATATPIEAATSDAELIRVPLKADFIRGRHVAGDRRGRHDRGAREIAFAAEAHAVQPVAVEGGDGALAALERIRTLSETGTAPRLANLSADRSEHFRDRFT